MQAVIFDLDGLLIDSEPLWQQAEMELFTEVGIQLTPELCRLTTGLRVDEVVRHWFSRHPWRGMSQEDLVDRLLTRVEALILERGRPLPGALQAPAVVRERGLRVALASSSPLRIIRAALRKLQLTDAFEVVVSAESLAWGKPHPGVYLETAEALGILPTACVAVEDSLNGLIAAKAARMRAIAVPEPPHRQDPRLALADVTLVSLVELGPALDRLLNDFPHS